MARAARTLGIAAGLAALAAAGVWSLYRTTLDYGFDYDDYHFVRPYPPGELRAAFHGPWDPHGIEVPFYRPLTIAFYAGRFELFGLDSRAHHIVSLSLFALAAMLAGAWVWRTSRRPGAAALAAALFVTHPSMPYALVAWITNQMHLLQTIVVLVALIWWSYVRARRTIWWMPLLLLAAAAFLIKEDGVMLLPSVLALHWLRRQLVEPALAPVPRGFVALAAIVVAALLLLRADALAGLGGYAWPSIARAWDNLTLGLNRVFRLVPARRPWQPAASWFATLLPLLALAFWRRTTAEVRYVYLAGAVLALSFNLPFAFVTKNEQMHLVALGAALVLTGSGTMLLDGVRMRAWRPLVASALAAGIVSFAAVARHISTDFAPFGPIVLRHDAWVKDWAAVPQELRDYLHRKLEPGASGRIPANPAAALDFVAFGLHSGERGPDGTFYRWMAEPQVEIHVMAAARQVEIPIRHEIGAFREAATVAVEADGRTVDSLVLADGAWRVSRLALRSGASTPFRKSHRIRLRIDRVWRPSELIPGSNDTRLLGLQIGEIKLR